MSESLISEQLFKDIPEYDAYEISECGILRSKDRVVVHSNGRIFNIKGVTITPKLPKGSKYFQSMLWKNGEYKLFRIHQLVAKAWIENPNNYTTVNHIDGNPFNNCASNLEWCTQQHNCMHTKKILRRNLNISLTTINEVYEENKELSLVDFIELLKLKAK